MSVLRKPTPPEQPHTDEMAGSATLEITRWRGDLSLPTKDQVAVEVPVALEFNGISHAVMLATPCDLEAFALGFALSEGIIRDRTEFFHTEAETSQHGITLHCEITGEAFQRLKTRRRNLAGRTGCGLCGVESLEQVFRSLSAPVPATTLALSSLQRALAALPERQRLNRQTGALHGAAWCNTQGELLLVFEDVGRHNALDKLIGAIAQDGLDPGDGFALITSRASVEMVQKAATVGIPALAAISAPTALAVETADQVGLILLGFARGNECVAYAHGDRIIR